MHQTDTSAQMGRKIFKVTMTEGQKNYLGAEPGGTAEWWERLADITEIAPTWLRENVPGGLIMYLGRQQFKDVIKQKSLMVDRDMLIVVLPVPQKDSGVLTRVEELA